MEIVKSKCIKCGKKYETLDMDGHLISKTCDECTKQ